MSAMHNAKTIGHLLKDTTVRWWAREPFRNSAIISYYTIFSLPGLLVIIVNLAGYFFGKEEVVKKLTSEIQGVIGSEAARDVAGILTRAWESEGFTAASIVGVATLIFGATGVFYQLQKTLDIVWEVKPEPKRKFLKLIMDRVFSFGLILTVGFLLLISLVLSAALSYLGSWAAIHFSNAVNILFRLLDLAISLSAVTVLFAAIYKFLPDAVIRWKDVWVGAFVTAVLFVLAKYLLGFYFTRSDPASTYGAAGSIVLIMLWVTYAGLILLFGAEFTRIYADRFGEEIRPAEFAVSTKVSAKQNEPDEPEDTERTPSEPRDPSFDSPH
jgi:membrane protein